MNSGKGTFASAYYQLSAGIAVTTMAGDASHPFKGHFDGDGHTLTFNCGTEDARFNEEYCAPFRYINGADIHDLTVAGTIYTAQKFAAGIAGKAVGTNTITNCFSSITIDSNITGDGTHGGFVGVIDGGSTTINSCAFYGSLQGSTTNSCGGFVGRTNGSGAANFTGCLFAPASLTVGISGCATYSRGATPTLSDCYYTCALGTTQGGTQVYATAPVGSPYTTLTLFDKDYYLPKEPVITNVTATDITPNSATISWEGTSDCSNYKVRYRKGTSYVADFEDGLPADWTKIDADGDGNNWGLFENKSLAHSGKHSMVSASYLDYEGLAPDNWLISPKIDLGGTLSVWLRGMHEDYYQEHFAIYLSTKSEITSQTDFTVTLVPEQEATYDYKQYTADLSSYAGQQGYIAIRHFNCYNIYNLMLDDFEVFCPDDNGTWTEKENVDPAGTAINGLEPLTTYEYQVVYNYEGGTYHTPSAILTTSDDLSVPTDLSVSGITSNAADISWTGYTEKYNLRYRAYTNQTAQVTLNVPEDIWGDGSGYQMLLDANHNTYGSVIPESGPLTSSGDAPAGLYDNFKYKIPKDADGALDTENIVNKNKVTIEIPAGIYDWCIVNPTPGDRIWIASENGNVGGRQDNFVFEPGKHYTFTVSDEGYDRVDMTVDTEYSNTEGSDAEWTKVNDITAPYAISNLQPSNLYQVQVQSVKGDRQSEWATILFTTRNIILLDNGDNSTVITTNNGNVCNVMLSDRTLYKDGAWNTIVLPFDVTLSGSPLAGAVARPLNEASIEGTTLNLTFGDAVTELVAGTPYIIKWDKADGYDEASEDTRDIKNPVFSGVTVSTDKHDYDNNASDDDLRVRFLGTYKSTTFDAEDKSILFMGEENTLYYPLSGASIGAQRAYFKIGDGSSLVKQFVLNFGDDEATGIVNVEGDSSFFTLHSSLSGWFTLDGRRLDGKPSRAGVYINNGVKRVIK